MKRQRRKAAIKARRTLTLIKLEEVHRDVALMTARLGELEKNVKLHCVMRMDQIVSRLKDLGFDEAWDAARKLAVDDLGPCYCGHSFADHQPLSGSASDCRWPCTAKVTSAQAPAVCLCMNYVRGVGA